MIIKKVEIAKFRGFKNVGFSLGEYITLIAGQNGTQKSTLLGILTQTFTIPNAGHKFSTESPLTGGTFRSAFQDKFRLSPTLDTAGSHLWTLFFHDNSIHPDIDESGGFTIESIPRNTKTSGTKKGIRFWQKGKRDAGSGYVQIPVIFLSLKRLIPIAEAGIFKKNNISLTDQEKLWFSKHYNKILLGMDSLQEIDYLHSHSKNTLGVTTDYYDWNTNSAGQDNISRILLAFISFQRLKENFKDHYKGGILAIDEIDATLYPGSQIKLIDFLSSHCKKLDVQVVATTHSLHTIDKVYKLKNANGRSPQFGIIYLKKVDREVVVHENPDYNSIVNNLNVSIGKTHKARKFFVHTEDSECAHFAKAILGRKYPNLHFPDITLGCGNLIQLGKKKVESFSHPNSIVILDGDAKKEVNRSKLKNYICLPGDHSPEIILAEFLSGLSDKSPFWEEKRDGYSKQVCFSEFDLNDIKSGRTTAKKWYLQQLDSGAWGARATNLFKYFLKTIPDEKAKFLAEFDFIYKNLKH
ncbi:AAA family ATPase [Gilvimarinus sp. SDUM040013]|uniref:AAA family ATPase n=1 Tax=Gilvimarinus gilvus TaxID=3058038 RepID=A0ABU4RZZ1_9GAMM|nr:AAA family ATPase [Gilvimarinus sp. SDUM040013]MDO3386001.1 AAA family ATPase [Gilvimarinus sp. SDUM040013]MDX6850456.1 AAA family ATPase [Gilvimarinus sp. SDUM040013]